MKIANSLYSTYGLTIVLALLAISCGAERAPSCRVHVDSSRWASLISEDQAIEAALETAGERGPATEPIQDPEIELACLMTLRIYEDDVLEGSRSSNPDLVDLDAPIWVVQFNGIVPNSRFPDSEPWKYLIVRVNGLTGDATGLSARFDPLFK